MVTGRSLTNLEKGSCIDLVQCIATKIELFPVFLSEKDVSVLRSPSVLNIVLLIVQGQINHVIFFQNSNDIMGNPNPVLNSGSSGSRLGGFGPPVQANIPPPGKKPESNPVQTLMNDICSYAS